MAQPNNFDIIREVQNTETIAVGNAIRKFLAWKNSTVRADGES